MKSGSNAWHWQLRRLVVDALIGASVIAVVFAAIDVTTGVPYMMLILGAIALVGIGLTLETRQPKPAQSHPPSIEHLGPALVDATRG